MARFWAGVCVGVFSFWEDAGLAAAVVVEVVAVVAGATGFLLAARGTATGGAGADGAPRASLSSSYSFHSSTWSRSYAWFISYKLSFSWNGSGEGYAQQ